MRDKTLAMRDTYNGLCGSCGADIFENGLRRRCIQGGERFVEQQHLCINQQSTGDGNALCLPLAESGSAFATGIIESAFVIQHEVCICQMQCLAHRLVGSGRVAEEQVITDSAG